MSTSSGQEEPVSTKNNNNHITQNRQNRQNRRSRASLPNIGLERVSRTKVKKANSVASWNSFKTRFGRRSSHPVLSDRGSVTSSVRMRMRNVDRWRDDITNDLNTAGCLSDDLKDSIHNDLHSCRSSVSGAYELIRSRQDLAGSIAQSYDLEDNCDTYSYISNCLSNANSGATSARSNMRRHSFCSSCDSHNSVLANDSMYPGQLRDKRRNRKARRESWKHDSRQKIYSVQQPLEPRHTTYSGVAFTRNLELSYPQHQIPEHDTFV